MLNLLLLAIVYYITRLFVISVLTKAELLSFVGWATLFCPPFIESEADKSALKPLSLRERVG
jgi:hypothetical protein